MTKSKGSFRKNSIYRRSLYLFAVLTLLPALAISIGSLVVGYYNGKQQAYNQLTSIASLKEIEITSWVEDRQNDLVFILNAAYGLDRIQTIYKLARRDLYYDYYYEAVKKSLQRYMDTVPGLIDISLLDQNNTVILSTEAHLVNRDYSGSSFLDNASSDQSSSLCYDPKDRNFFLVSSTPIMGTDGNRLGMMFSRASINTLMNILLESSGLGKTGESYIYDADFDAGNAALFTVLSDPQDTQFARIDLRGSQLNAENKTQSDFIYNNYFDKRVAGVAREVKDLNITLIIEQDFSEAFTAIITSLTVNLTIAFTTLLIAIAASLIVTRTITKPIIELADTAASIASGDLNRRAEINQDDEIGLLATTFNNMTSQLNELIGDLEKRVDDRTWALKQRALQLETSARVSREVTSILNIDELLIHIVDLIHETFGYYNVHIYLLDEEKGFLVLSAVSGKAQPHQFISYMDEQNLNSKAVKSKQAILLNDTRQTNDFFADNELPETRSELVIPLRMGSRLIGTLDIHSKKQDEFTTEDTVVFQGLGDQIAIAIENARLYKQSLQLAMMEERNRIARDLHDSVTQSLFSLGLLIEGWRQTMANGDEVKTGDILDRMEEINQQILKEMRLLIHELRPPILHEEGLINALQKRLDAVENRTGILTQIFVEDPIFLSKEIEECLYYIALEALNNGLKHSQESQVTISIYTEENKINMKVTDNGCGFDPDIAIQSGGIGLISMKERADSIGGEFSIHSQIGNGTCIQVRLDPEEI